MKQTFFLVSFICALTLSATQLRIDITGLEEYVVVKSSIPQTSQSAKSRGKLTQKSIILPPLNQWQPFTLEFTSPVETQIEISLRSTSDAPILVDDFKSDLLDIKDGGFEKINKKKRFLLWKGGNDTVISDAKLLHSGKFSARITYKSRLTQGAIKVPANKKVTISGFYRRMFPAPSLAEIRKSATVPAGSNVVFDPTFERTKPLIISTGRLELRSTYENCSVYLNRLPAEKGKKLKAEFFFRKAGEKKYLPALPPSEISQEQAWRGSLFNLTENTDYEFKAVISGEKGHRKEVQGKFRTLNSQVPGETILLPPGKCTVKVTSGTPGKYKRYTSNGKIITATPGTNALFDLEDKEYIIFENMVIDAKGAQNGFSLKNCRNIIIRNCEVYNFGRKSAGPRYGANMYYSGGLYSADGKLLYDDQAFKLVSTKNVLIERCYVRDPAFGSQTWLFAHPSGPGCLKVIDCANTVIRWNDFVGKDGIRFIDHIIGPPNTSFRGGFARDADIYGNFFAFSNDDGAELEGGGMNIRCYGNRIEGTLSGLSTGPISLGPTYIIANLYANPGDEDGSGSSAYKNGGGADGVCHTRGELFMLHNTISDAHISKYGVGNFSQPHKDYFPARKAYLRNNLIRATNRFYHRLWHNFKTDCDYNLLERFPGGKPETVAKDMADIKKSGLEKHGIFAKIQYADALSGNYALAAGSPGYNRVQKQNNFPGFPHCGAYQGKKGEWFPKRPLAMTIDKTELHWLQGDDSVRTLALSTPRGMKFKVVASDEFFTVKEKNVTRSGSDEVHTYEVALLKEKMSVPRRYSGAILFRTPEGLSLPVTLYANRRIPLRKAIADTRRFIPAVRIPEKGKDIVFEVDIKTPGIYFMALTGNVATPGNGKVNFSYNGQSSRCELPLIGDKNWMLLKSFQHRRLVPVTLAAGKTRFRFTPLNDVKINEVIVTREPWVIMRNRALRVKGADL